MTVGDNYTLTDSWQKPSSTKHALMRPLLAMHSVLPVMSCILKFCSCCAAFGQPVNEVFSSLSAAPVASASLGQVYKGQLRDIYGGGVVAVKVQRPFVQASVALDLLLMRRFAAFSQTFPQVACKSFAAYAWCSSHLVLLQQTYTLHSRCWLSNCFVWPVSVYRRHEG